MVEVSLERLVAIHGTESLWPEEFAGLVARLEENTEERTQWKVLADWCQEHDEIGMSKAFDWVARRPEVKARRLSNTRMKLWELEGVPFELRHQSFSATTDTTTLPGCVAELAMQLRQLSEKLF